MEKQSEFLDIAIGLSDGNKWDTDKLSRIDAFIKQESEKQSEERKIRNNMLTIQYRIEDYLKSEGNSNKKILEIGHFIELYLKEMNLTKVRFADILELQPSNLHKYLTGTRKINTDLALKFSYFFNTKPETWIMVQAKNDIAKMKLKKGNIISYEKYDYKNVLREGAVIKRDNISKRDILIAKYADDLKEKYDVIPDMELLTKVAISCGPSIYNRNGSLISSSNPSELTTVKNNFLIKKLGLKDSTDLDRAIASVLDIYGQSNRNKYRAVVYYMLTRMLNKESVYK